MVGRAKFWPLAARWLHRRLFDDVDQADALIPQRPQWRVRWAEAEVTKRYTDLNCTIEVVQFNYGLWFARGVRAYYLVDATVWLPIDATTSVAFFQVMSFADRGGAIQHYDRLKARLPQVVTS